MGNRAKNGVVSFKFAFLWLLILNVRFKTSGQDGSVGRHGSPLHTITSKLLKCRTTMTRTSEIELNGSLTTMEFKKPHPSRLVGGERYWTGWSPIQMDKNSGGISQEREIPEPHRPLSPRFQCQEDKCPQLLAAKTSGYWIGGRKCWSPTQFPLKNPHMDSPTQTYSLWAPALGWQPEGHQWCTGRNWSVWHQGEYRPLSLC